MNNLFGNSASAVQITRLITAGSNTLVGSDKFMNFDRTDGNIIVDLPNLANFLDANSKSGNTINLNYILSDLTAGVSANTITLVCDSADNINGKPSFVTDTKGRYTLQATPAGWLMINQAGSPTEEKGIYNTSGMNFPVMDFSKINFTQYSGVVVDSVNSTVGSANYSLSYSSTLEYFKYRHNTDIVTLTMASNNILKGIEIEENNNSSLITVVLQDNPLLIDLTINKVGGSGTLQNITINNSPLLNNVGLNNNSLNVASVDGVLAYLDSTGVINGQVFLQGGLNAPPTGGAGNPNVVSLLSKGWTVFHN